MEKEFIPYEQALALKELGFNEPCLAFYNGKFIQSTEFDFDSYNSIDVKNCPLAPTFSQAFRWFREKHNIDGEIYLILIAHNGVDKEQQVSNKEYSFKTIINGIPQFINHENIYSSNKQAELACLNKLIEIVKNK